MKKSDIIYPMKKLTLITTLLLLLVSNLYSSPSDVTIITDSEYHTAVKDLIANAQKNIYINMFIIAYNPDFPRTISNDLLYELIKAKKRGVEIKIIMDQDSGSSLKGQYNDLAYFYLKNNDIDVQYDSPSQKLHTKLVIIDEKITVTGSHNWSKSALKDNREASVIIKSPEIAQQFIKWIKETPTAKRRIPSPPAKTPDIKLPYKFIINPEIGIKLSDMRMKLYLYLIEKWELNKRQTIELNYEEAAKYIGISERTKEDYRKNINKILYILQKKYQLLTFKAIKNQPAKIDLLDYNDKRKNYNPEDKDCFIVPGGFWEYGWIERLSASAKYFYFVSLIETNKTTEPNGWWTDSQKHLYKKYYADPRILSDGVMELNRYNLLKVQYGDLIYPFSSYLTAPKYLQLPLYSWDWYEAELTKLKEYYGEDKVRIAQKWAGVVLEENNLIVIEKLINYWKQNTGALVQYAVDKVSNKRIGNPKRSFAYIEGIILKEIEEDDDTEE